VNDLSERHQRPITKTEAPDERLERAVLADVRVLGLEHVEAELARLSCVATRRNELESRVGVDEAPYEPCARDSVDVHPRSRHPRATPFHAIDCRRCSVFAFAGPLAALGRQHRLQLLVGHSFDQMAFNDHRAPALDLDLLPQPLQILERLVAARECVDGLLDRDGADAPQSPPRLHPQVVWLGRQLMNEEQPAPAAERALRVRFS
jgi:hypothetical protein